MENGKEYPMPSGATLYVEPAPWGECKALHDALLRAVNGSGVSAAEAQALLQAVQLRAAEQAGEATDKKDQAAAAAKLDVLAVLTRKALEVGSSKELERAIFAAAAKALYKPSGGIESAVQFKADAVGYGVFDHPKCRIAARGDYYSICTAVVEENLRPFGQALFSALLGPAERRADSPA